jgi:ABC-type polysaccharide/polyol phosphate transport system ATPase subunit
MKKLEIKNLNLKFRVYHDRSPSIKTFLANVFKKRTVEKLTEFSALKNVTFSVNEGDRLGIIGSNGAGKSTLLKTISKIYTPTSGEIKVFGSLVPLLEIGAGFHPEFTGRENIHLNGAILGHTDEELNSVEQEVIEFAGIEEFADTAVKYYSTGMYMRLAFALATSIKPEILILDEVFAGGDVGFMHRAKERLNQLIDKASVIILVSHSEDLILEMCNRVIWLDCGMVRADGEPSEILNLYNSFKNDE